MTDITMMAKRYSELRRLNSHQERFTYLQLGGNVGRSTFGFERWMNQAFYRSTEWRNIRRDVIARDRGCDLGIEEFPIHDMVYVHHMNPLTKDDIVRSDQDMLNPEYLISVSHRTHNAIHYGDERLLPQPMVVRRPGDTKLW
jgi:hypothetical protein